MKALVTGATGLIGSQLVRALLCRGDSVRILARSASRAAPLRAGGAEVAIGDLGELDGASAPSAHGTPASSADRGTSDGPAGGGNPADGGSSTGRCGSANLSGLVKDIDIVFHLASAIHAPSETFERVDVRGTERLLEAAGCAGVKRFVFPGTLSSYDLAEVRPGTAIDERSPFGRIERLGNYARAKARAEAAVLAAHRRGKLEAAIVRLGLTCGLGASLFPAHVGRLKANVLVMFGDGRLPLPLVLLDNAVDALILAATVPAAGGESFNIVDDEPVTQDEYLALLEQTTGSMPRVVKLPRAAYSALGAVTALAAAARGKEPETTPYRVRSRLRPVRWDCSKAHRILEWHSRVPLRDGLKQIFRAHAAIKLRPGEAKA